MARAQGGEPQLVTKHGRAAAYVIGADQFEALRGQVRPQKTLGEHILDFPTGGPDDCEFDRLAVSARDVD